MKAKEYLRSVQTLRAGRGARLKLLEDMRQEREIMHGGRDPDEAAELEQRIEAEANEANAEIMKIVHQVEEIDDIRYKQVLLARYIDGMSLQETADFLGYCYDHTRKLHGQALVEFAKKYGLEK